VLGLMADDVLFMVPGREPFGKAEFAASAQAKDAPMCSRKAPRTKLTIRTIAGCWSLRRG
jgi:hypothetical protein